ncbi:hypothetical protein ACS33_15590 [Edwardsiella ictaluri]|nr:hypothetical protein ACS33_15590 [Edwardsiella ictaluri]
MVRQQRTGLHQFVRLCQGDVGGEGNQRVKVAGAELVGQIAQGIGAMGADQRQIGAQRALQQPGFAVERQALLALGDDGTDAGGGQKTAEPGAAAADLFNQGALRNQLHRHLPGHHAPPGLRIGADVGGDDAADPPVDDQRADARIDKGGIVGDQGQVPDAGLQQGRDQAGRGAYPHKAAHHNGHAVAKQPGGTL